jgi:FkbM family methyltransferase
MFTRNRFTKDQNRPSAIELLQKSQPMQMTVKERAAMTISCHDADNLPKVAQAGKVVTEKGKKLQIMHNGLKVLAGGYYGELIQEIIAKLKGHHEPQEEKVFYHLLERITRQHPTMIELGSHWAIYSLWFKTATKHGRVICCEPDPHNIQIGKQNMQLNNFTEDSSLIFKQVAAGSADGREIEFVQDSNPNEIVRLPIRSVDSLCAEYQVDMLDILHMDVQGVELDALNGTKSLIEKGKVRFMVVSTHHYVFSNDPMTHQKCEAFITQLGGHIIASHTVLQSYSGDGLIVASFDKRDKDFTVDISHNPGPALFRPYEEDLSVLAAAYNSGNDQSR